MFEIYIMVSEIHDNVDLVLGVKNFVYKEMMNPKKENM